MRYLFPALALLLPLTLTGCISCEGDDNTPAPECYSGTVVGSACMDGLLVEVDSRYPIGKPAGAYTNLVAAVNMEPKDSLNVAGQLVRKGQIIHFTYRPSAKAREAVCPQNTVPLPVPHVVLSNVGAGRCTGGGAQ
jgi:hypothetical protein